tara:strand:- start:560 stop:1150 length:591 start_codon:yes stop_codon:yes gene_type:complete
MTNSLTIKILLGISAVIIIFFFYSNLFKKEKKVSLEEQTIIKEQSTDEDVNTTTNIIKDVSYRSKDVRGNEYILNAYEGRIDLTNNKIIFLTNVKAAVNMMDGEFINIQSNFGKYNIDNYDTIFSKNVTIIYADNQIKGDYVDFSLERNSLIISKNVIYSNKNSLLQADVVEIDITTKKAKIFMYEKKKKVRIKLN